uniref:Uncharacterized protein n=1 Tax=Entomoneis paludosa TaxID=265537 RepID=A0A7S2Y9K6_9STRA|mmetsp:Transcript_23846/g.49543  ORF Transcript_23846/g.49543 Transcript_23846/m.49543 type:complete len:157 (+) Transcript_23846:200-670(+)
MPLFQNKLLQEERDFFQAKYLEQVSELQALRQELSKTKKEVVRLRQELMDRTPAVVKPSSETTEKEEDTASCLTDDEEEEEKTTNVMYEEDVELRQSAEKLLQWASYRATSGRGSYSRNGVEDNENETGADREHDEDEQNEDDADDLSSLTSKQSA